MSQQELQYWLLFHHTPFIGPMRMRELLGEFETPSNAYKEIQHNISSVNLPKKSINYLNSPKWDVIESELTWAQQDESKHIITFHDEEYPDTLKEIADPPMVLYGIGDIGLLKHPQIAIVGSRNPSKTGSENAYQFAYFLAKSGFTITSGMALGIDGQAHKGALSANGRTIAVTGTGLSRVYPARHRELAYQIIEKQGLLLSELPLETPPLRENFPRRNRIISGLSLGTLVVEAAQQSGSLITARTAGEQGREIFAIPGSIHNPLAKGCHQLIRQGAKLVENAEHILEELGHMIEWAQESITENNKDSGIDLPSEAIELLENLGFEPISVDMIVERSGLTPETVSSILLVLELQGYVEALSDGSYNRIK